MNPNDIETKVFIDKYGKVRFTIGVQTFTVLSGRGQESTKFIAKMLRKALKNLKNENH